MRMPGMDAAILALMAQSRFDHSHFTTPKPIPRPRGGRKTFKQNKRKAAKRRK